jgi:tRNA(His) 5'-end guanylyltransferase
MASISASLATANFNKSLLEEICSYADVDCVSNMKKKFKGKDGEYHTALFDSRVFTIPEAIEVENYFIWRQQDATRNSVQMAAQALYSHKELHGKSGSDLQEMIFQKGINWNDYAVRCKRGAVIAREVFQKDDVTRSRWVSQDPPVFTQDRSYLRGLIPLQETWEKDVVKPEQSV